MTFDMLAMDADPHQVENALGMAIASISPRRTAESAWC